MKQKQTRGGEDSLGLSEEEGVLEGWSGRLGSAEVAFISRLDK